MRDLGSFGASGHRPEKIQLLEALPPSQVAPLLADCPVVLLPAGAVLQEKDRGGRLFIVLRGALRVTHEPQAGRGDGTALRILPGECAGELSVLDGEASTEQISALEDAELLVIEATVLWKLVDESNGFARNLLRLLSFRIRAANAQLRRRQKLGEFYRQLSMVDSLTGLHNRAWLNDQLPVLVEQAQASGNPLSLLMIDLDHFKQFNDTHGHVSGDLALQAAARVIAAALRPTDHAARFGGEELTVLLPGTAEAGALLVAQRLCERLRRTVIFADLRHPLPHITASLGVAALAPGQHAEALLSAADAALYRAKENGRDCVSL